MEYKLGLDIGISSVGYGLVDCNGCVIQSGVRLFDAGDASKNVERRGFRSGRRLKRRRQNRVARVKRLLENNGVDVKALENIKFNNTLETRNKGLTQALDLTELYFVLTYLVKTRGISYLDDAMSEETDKKKASGFQNSLNINAKAQEDKLPCEIQLEKYNSYNKYRGNVEVMSSCDDENDILINVFTTSAYIKEAEAILKEQAKHFNFIDDTFIEQYVFILESKRKYYIGPGDEQNRTNYGRFKTNGDTLDNIFESLIGKCSVYNGRDGQKTEFRASMASYTAQEFNLLQDLNNLVINKKRLTTEEKELIVYKVKNELTRNSSADFEKIITAVIKEPIEDIAGARIDEKNKRIYHTFEQFRKMKSVLSEHDIDIDTFTREELDEIAFILTINTEKEGILEAFKKSIDNNKLREEQFHNNTLEVFINLRKKNPSHYTKWHSFSIKIMNELMEETYNTSKNQMQILTELGIFKESSNKYKDLNKIPVDDILEDIYNPVVKRSITQAIKIVNAVIKKYGYPTDIVIEMAREDNEDDQKKNYQKFQKKNAEELDKIIAQLKNEGVTITDSHFRNHNALKTKLRLWEEQNRKCLYSGKDITINDILDNQSKVEIDHIIPISISFDDSRSNKVLVFSSENRLKGNRTPFGYLDTVSHKWSYEKYELFVNTLFKSKKISFKKQKNLLFKEDITKQEVLKGFINRNLNDTRYACRVVLNVLQSYMKANSDTKVKVLNGAFTDQLRRVLNISKNRDTFHHHGIDALILCYAKRGLDKYRILQHNNNILDIKTGEVIDKEALYNMNSKDYRENIIPNEMSSVKSQLERAMDNMLFSHKVDKKPNRSLANQTIYSTRKIDNKDMIISKKSDLYTNDKKQGKDLVDFIHKKENDILMAKHDPKTWDIIKNVMEEYSDKDNPFLAYKLEHGEPIRKYSKKGNGPFVTNLKYIEKTLVSCIDISHKYNTKNKKVVLLHLNPYRCDVYYNKSTNKYHLVGIKYSDLKFTNKQYVLSEEQYNKNLIHDKVIKEGYTLRDLESLNIEFRFSLYKNDILQYEKDGEEYTERFLSKASNKINTIESKPISSKLFPRENLKTNEIVYDKRKTPSLSKTKYIKKVNVDVLGNIHLTEKEKFSLNIKLDNKMI